MTKEQVITWLVEEFKPLVLATPTTTIEQQYDNALRYWNTHSAYKVVGMFDVPAPGQRVQLHKKFKTVAEIFPDQSVNWVFQDHPLWTLLGIQVLDNVTQDLIMLGEAFRSYRNYVGCELRWKFEKDDNPAVGGYLYVQGFPRIATKVYVVGALRIYNDEDIVSEHILDWLLRYTKALVRVIEGNTLRKSSIIGVKNDGQELLDEGKKEVEGLQEELRMDGRWLAFARRF